MFIHYWDVHYPYIPPERMRGLFYKGGNPTDPNNHALDEWWDHPVGAMARDTWLRTDKRPDHRSRTTSPRSTIARSATWTKASRR